MTSKFKIRLFRGGDEVEDMPSVDEEDCLTEPVFERQTFLGTLNDVKIQYSKRVAGTSNPGGSGGGTVIGEGSLASLSSSSMSDQWLYGP